VSRPGLEPATRRSQVQRPNHYTTEPPNTTSLQHMLYMLSKRQFTEQLVLIGGDVQAGTWFNLGVTGWWCVVYTSRAGAPFTLTDV